MFSIAAAIYIPISILFLKYPEILGKKKIAIFNNSIKNIAHRGGSGQGPQNTMFNFIKSSKSKYDIQTDVCITKDNKVVIHHDLSLQRTCGVKQLITNINYDQLPTLKSQMKQHFLPGIIKTNQNKLSLLEQVLDSCPNSNFNIQIKGARPKDVQIVGQILRNRHCQSRVVWGAVSQQIKEMMMQKYPEFRVFACIKDYLKTQLFFLFGLLPFISLKYQVYNIPMATQFFMAHKEDQFKNQLMSRIKWRIIMKIIGFFNWTSKPLIQHLKLRGIQVNYWVCNTQAQFQLAKKLGATGIMTDLPQKLHAFINK